MDTLELVDTIEILSEYIEMIKEEPELANELFSNPESVTFCLGEIIHMLKLINENGVITESLDLTLLISPTQG